MLVNTNTADDGQAEDDEAGEGSVKSEVDV